MTAPDPAMPAEAVEAAAKASWDNWMGETWEDVNVQWRVTERQKMRKILAAAYPFIAASVEARTREATRLEGWVPFGTHAPFNGVPLEFSDDDLGEDLLPRWERVARSAVPEGSDK